MNYFYAFLFTRFHWFQSSRNPRCRKKLKTNDLKLCLFLSEFNSNAHCIIREKQMILIFDFPSMKKFNYEIDARIFLVQKLFYRYRWRCIIGGAFYPLYSLIVTQLKKLHHFSHLALETSLQCNCSLKYSAGSVIKLRIFLLHLSY